MCVCTSHKVLFLCAVVVERIKANRQCYFHLNGLFLQAVSVTSVHILAQVIWFAIPVCPIV